MFPTPDILLGSLTRITAGFEAVLHWIAALPIALMVVVALAATIVLSGRWWLKGVFAAAIVLCGVAAVSLLGWQSEVAEGSGALGRDALGRDASERNASQIAALHGLWTQWDDLSRTLPPPAHEEPAAEFDTADDALASLSAKAASVKEQVAALQETGTGKGRSIDHGTAVKLSDYLRQYGPYRAVVSCAPDDVEAYTYANQLANVLRAAGWDANGPEATVSDGDGPAMAVRLFVRNPAAPDAAKALADAFTRFNVPYQSGVAGNSAIPDTSTIELYVPKKS